MKKKRTLKGFTLITVSVLFSSLLAGPAVSGNSAALSESKSKLEQTIVPKGSGYDQLPVARSVAA